MQEHEISERKGNSDIEQLQFHERDKLTTMLEILNNYKPYEFPKIGIFKVDTNVYQQGVGWILKEEENLIIGEADECYVTRLLTSGHGEWVGEEVIQYNYILPIGLHPTRLVRWKETQLKLF